MQFRKHLALLIIGITLVGFNACLAQSIKVEHDANAKRVAFGNEKLSVTFDYNKKAAISKLVVNGQEVIRGDAGMYSMISVKGITHSTLHLQSDPSVKVTENSVIVEDINYGNSDVLIHEAWTFTIRGGHIDLEIKRTTSKSFTADEIGSAVFTFDNINTWEGAYQDYGGLAWFYLFNKKRDTYGVYSSSSEFWNSKTGNGLSINVTAPPSQVAMKFTRTTDDRLVNTISVTPGEMELLFDPDTKRRRYVRDTTDVWAPVDIPAGTTNQTITLSYFNFEEKFGRGTLKGVNQQQVSDVLNTIARIGVIGKKHFGGNSWHTPYGPICLHEQYIAQMGLGINDDNYLDGYKECLDYYRDNAIKPDGRVWPRWAYSNEDAMPGIFTDKGFYEAQWGYLLDSNPDFVINVVELFEQNGDIKWLKTHQASCEKALDWILNRDTNGNGLVEMMTDSHKQKRGSDWIDIIWASYENAFVNAKLYYALEQWAGVESLLGNATKEKYYRDFAKKLKASFNKSTDTGGFWDAQNGCYIHWREKDGSIHGRNMVTPVNFMAIAYGINDDAARTKTILDAIEVQMQKENLFFWPICLYTYAPGEGNDWQFPFPNYENGDIFLSWGSVGARAYAAYKPEIALKYINNVLKQYSKDGLAFQRYGRAKQDGLGDDILSGNALSVVGLYQAIYGINPKHNRFYLEPHITPEIAGTQVKYNYRGERLTIDLDLNNYAVANDQFKVVAKENFGFYAIENGLSYFQGNADMPALTIHIPSKATLTVDVRNWNKLIYEVKGLKSNTQYSVTVNGKKQGNKKASDQGILTFETKGDTKLQEVIVAE